MTDISNERLEVWLAFERGDSEISRRSIAVYRALLDARERIAKLEAQVRECGGPVIRPGDISAGKPVDVLQAAADSTPRKFKP